MDTGASPDTCKGGENGAQWACEHIIELLVSRARKYLWPCPRIHLVLQRAESRGAPLLRLPVPSGVLFVATRDMGPIAVRIRVHFDDSAERYSHADGERNQKEKLTARDTII